METMDNQKTQRFRKLVDGIVEMVKSKSQTKNIQAIIGISPKNNVIDVVDFEVSKLKNEYLETAVNQALSEFKEMFPEESAPVCKDDKPKRINFPNSKKRSNK